MKGFLTSLQRFYTNKSSKQRVIILGLSLVSLISLGYGAHYFMGTPSSSIANLTEAPDEIKGKIITLRMLKEEYYIDYHNMFSNTARKALEFQEAATLGNTIYFLQHDQKKMARGVALSYCIFDNKDNRLIGWLEVRDPNDQDPGQMGCWVNEAYWGGGRFQEALDLASRIYFKLHPDVKSYIAHVRLWNQRSYHALKKCGFKDVGYFYEGGKATRYVLELPRR